MKNKLLLLIIILFITNTVFADPFGYSGTLKLKIESKNYIVIHHHDWTSKTENERDRMMTSDQNPFNKKNNYAYVECIDKKTRKTVFKKPSNALTSIYISADEKYIVGISTIKLDNPNQLVIFSTKGELIKKRHIASEEAKLTQKEFNLFKKKFQKEHDYLTSLKRVYNLEGYFYVDFLSMGMPGKLGDAWSFLYKYVSHNHLSKNYSESVTNWVHWYYEKNPKIKFVYVSKQLIAIEILDPKKKYIRIKIEE